MGLQRQKQGSNKMAGQLLQWSEVEHAGTKYGKRVTLMYESIAVIVLGTIAVICGLIGKPAGGEWGIALWIGFITMAIGGLIIGIQIGLPLAEFNKKNWENNSTKVLAAVAGVKEPDPALGVLAFAAVGAGTVMLLVWALENKALIYLGIISIISETIVFFVVKIIIAKLKDIINN